MILVENVSKETLYRWKSAMSHTHRTNITDPLVEADGGEIMGDGVTGHYVHDSKALTLQLTIKQYPFYEESDHLEEHLAQIVTDLIPVPPPPPDPPV